MNKVILIGNLGKDPEVRRTDKGNIISKFSLATNENYKDHKGDWQTVTEWHNIEIWREVKVSKGDTVLVEGKIKTDKYEKDGKTHYSTKISAMYVKNLTPKKNGESETSNFEPEDESDDLPF